jgi:hypothetical protein
MDLETKQLISWPRSMEPNKGEEWYKLPLTGPTAKTIPGQKKALARIEISEKGGTQKARTMDWTSLGHDNEVVLQGVCIRHVGIWHHA